MDVKGRTFVGNPEGVEFEPDCEGSGEAGQITFRNDGTVELVWPGSDEIDDGTYTQDRNIVNIYSNGDRKNYQFSLSKDGIELTYEEYSAVFRDEKYPWK